LTDPTAGARPLLEAVLARGGGPTRADLEALIRLTAPEVEDALRAFAVTHGAAALDVLTGLTSEMAPRHLRRAAKRALDRLAQSGVTPAASGEPSRALTARGPIRPRRAWVSGIDGSGSRAIWIVFEDDRGSQRLCSLIVNDTAGILDVAGGDITKKRLQRELAGLRASQKLPWVEMDPARALGLVAEALSLHRASGTTAPSAFERWWPLFATAAPPPPPAPGESDSALVERTGTLLELPELAGWFLEPEAVQADAVDLLQARQSRLVVSDQVRAEREVAIVTRVVERELGPLARRLWARRLVEMVHVFAAAGRDEHARLAEAAAAGLLDENRDIAFHPFARGLASRALEVAGEVSAGRLSAAEVSRRPAPPRASPASA
jgi:hypothetical protein